jgi:hypothetical protein
MLLLRQSIILFYSNSNEKLGHYLIKRQQHATHKIKTVQERTKVKNLEGMEKVTYRYRNDSYPEIEI